LADALAALEKTDPLLAMNAILVLEAMGATFTGGAPYLGNIPPELWDAARSGYFMGFALGLREVTRMPGG
jgi:hypothetical protein